jgi:soluble lytic murein transglycosylase-like protein
MDRVRLALLVVCALLTTTVWPFESTESSGVAPTSSETVAREVPAVSSVGPIHDEAAIETSLVALPDIADAIEVESSTEEAVFSRILQRLSMRHTALPERERVALVRTILREARANDLDPDLVVAVIEVESAGYHLAVSHVGAMGLMQLLPATGKEIALRMGIEWSGPDTLFDPTTNIRLGTAYLSQLMNRYGSVKIALAAYNWGPGRIDRRLRRGRVIPSRYIEQVMRAIDHGDTRLVNRS